MYEANAISSVGTIPARGYANIPDAPRPPAGQIAEQVEEASRLIQALHQELEGLELRISGALRPSPPSPSGGGTDKANRPVMSSHAELLVGLNLGLSMAIERARSMAARADL